MFKFASALIRAHIGALTDQYDPVVVHGALRNYSKFHYFYVILVNTLVQLYGIGWLHAEQGVLQWAALPTSPYIWMHQALPPKLWRHLDFGCAIFVSAIWFFHGVVIFKPKVEPKFVILKNHDKISIGSKELGPRISNEICRFYRASKRMLDYTIWLFYACAAFFYYWNVWQNNVYTLNVGSLFFWFYLFAAEIFYALHALFASVLFAIISSRVIRIRQSHLLDSFNRVNRRLSNSSGSDKSNVMKKIRNQISTISTQWITYLRLNSDLLHICHHINAYAHYLDPRLSITIPVYISAQCYVLYVLLFVQIDFTISFYLWIVLVEINVLLLLIINECARIESKNREIETGLGRFCVKASRVNRLVGDKKNLAKMIKSETLMANHRLRPYTFHFLKTFPITTNTYNAIIWGISTYFMFIFKNQTKYHH